MEKIIGTGHIFKEYEGTWLDRSILSSWLKCRWWLPGLLLVVLHIAIAWLSPQFAYQIDLVEKPVLVLVFIELLAGALYLLAVWSLQDIDASGRRLWWVFAVGALMRVAMLASTPILEDDFYRYLWDGAVVSSGENPYVYAPADIADNSAVPPGLRQLAKESGPVHRRINHPGLRTIYPPVAQAAYSLAHRIAPWNITAWRVVLLLYDALSVFILIVLLRKLDLPSLWVAIYWWNPLLVKEILNSAHMDIIAVPFVLAAVLFTIDKKHLWAVFSLALGLGTKIWPVVLLPLILRPLFPHKRRFVMACGLFGVMVLALFYPILASSFDANSGFIAYGQRWEMNDALFMVFVWVSQISGSGDPQFAARIFYLAVIVVLIIRQTFRTPDGPDDLLGSCLLIVSALFLLSPTQFPWYYVWVLPFLVIRPRFSLLLLTMTLPLYYLRYFFDARGNVDIFDYGIVWLEYAPVWYFLVREFYIGRRLTS